MEKSAHIATMIGRYYAMDRDSNWKRIKTAYDLYAAGKGTAEKDPIQAITHFYAQKNDNPDTATDYYLPPIILNEQGIIKDKDSVIFWNYRRQKSVSFA